LLKEAKTILSNPEATAEQKVTVQQMIDDAKRLQGEAIQMQHIQDLEQSLGAAGASASHANADESKGNGDIFDVPYMPDGSSYKTVVGYIRAIVGATPTPVNPTPKPSKNLVWFDDSKDVQSQSGAQRKDMVESVGASGGFLVPPEAFTNVLAAQQQLMSLIRSRATIIRMRRRQIQIPVLDQTGTTSGRPHWFGGLRAYWTEEAGLKTQSDAAWRQITLVAHKLAAYARVSDELIDDAVISLTDFLMGAMGFPGVIAWMEEDAFWNGTGAGQPQGIIPSPATLTYNREDQNNVVYNDLIAMLQRFLPNANGIWVASQSTLGALLRMSGPSANPNFVWGPGPLGQTALGDVPGVLLGRPIYFSEHLPVMSNTSVGDIALVDPRYYLIGDRQATTLASTIYDRFQYDETSYRAVHRVDGQPWLSAPLTFADGSTQVSPFVILGSKST